VSLYSYVVRWDHGFAPNPFYGVCSLATCKPQIRRKVKVGDWIMGTGSAERKRQAHVIFLMCVSEIISFDAYWSDSRFFCKRPVMNGSLKQRFGDNIYHRAADGTWHQADSRHSQEGSANDVNLKTDTGTTDRVLIGSDFIYWGADAPPLPASLRHFAISSPGHKSKFTQVEIASLVAWAKASGRSGLLANPLEWKYESRWRS
jgi:hypothetical protein